jgi:uncharacterized protein with HEPN domain
MRSDPDRLKDILRAIDNALRYKAAGPERFLQDELLQVWVLHHLVIIGEAARGLTEKVRSEHAGTSWAQIIGLRNIVVHEYFGLNLRQVWMVVERDLPKLRVEVEAMLEALGGGS